MKSKGSISDELEPLRLVHASLVAARANALGSEIDRRRAIRAVIAAGKPAARLLGRSFRDGTDAEAAWAAFLLTHLPRRAVNAEIARIITDKAVPEDRKTALLALFGKPIAEPATSRSEARLESYVLELLESLDTAAQMDEAAGLILEEIEEADRESFLAELLVRGGERAKQLVRAVAARSQRPPIAISAPFVLTVAPTALGLSELLAKVKQMPDDAEAHSALGVALLESKEVPRACFHLERAAALDPELAIHHWNAAAGAEQARRVGRMYLGLRSYVERALTASPTEASRVAVAREFMHSYEVGVLEAYPGVDPSAYARGEDIFANAYSSLVAGATRDAVAGFLRVLRLVPSHFPSWTNLGAAYADLGQRKEAVACLKRALALNPKDRLARRRLAALGAIS